MISPARSAAVNVLQGLGAQQIKELADGLGKETITENEDGTTTTTFTPTTESELLRSALQGIVGCAAGAAGGSGDCGSAAMGAAGSVAVNLLINSLTDEQDEATFDKDGNQTDADTEGDLQHSKNVTALIGLIAEGLGLDANAASTAGQIETENNQLGQENKGNLIQTSLCPPGQEAVCNTNNVIFLTTTTLGQLALQAAGGDKELAIKCAGADTSSECGVVRQRYNELSAALGAGWQQLDADTIVQRIAQIDAAESTLDQLFGDDEVRKQLTREFLADGSITSAGLEAKLAELKQREWDESTIGQLYNSVVSLFSSGDEVQPDFETETTPSGDPNDPKDKQNAIIMGMVLAVYAAAQGADVDLGNPPPFMPDQVGYTADDQPLFQDPGTDEYYVLDEQGNRQDVPLQSNVVKDYLAAKARLEQSPTPEKEIGVTRDGKTIYRDQSGNEYVKDENGRRISLQEYEGGTTNANDSLGEDATSRTIDANNPYATGDPSAPGYRRARDPNLAVGQAREDLEEAGIDASGISDQQLLDMMWDPATQKYRPNEAVQSIRLQNETGINVTGRATGSNADIMTDRGEIDLKGNNNPNGYNETQFISSINSQAKRYPETTIAIDVSNIPPSRRQSLLKRVDELRAKGIDIITFGE
ncbi:hypothetical protein [Alterisphingorhabdus coralli]|uniref:Uncharacterized protein n=1 Tax=Alterisphingorhabdus coralli TaxID=3071408 RepID=A0AA97F4T7_9SPHN|nr:hypothetical protein [Parasphingorhabdus sp. SCSIO 66989]WOE74038.1 hypothetical protein RB602_09205 [Parasphingorhabdus sp. SCSIO 66989]